MLLRSVLEVSYPTAAPTVLAVHEPELPAPRPPRLLDRVRMALRARHGSRRTEKAYVGWIRRYILFHDKRHPAEMGATEVTQFLSWLAAEKSVAASTQNQALRVPIPNILGLRIWERTKEAPRPMSAQYHRLMTRRPGPSSRNTLTGRAVSHRLCSSGD